MSTDYQVWMAADGEVIDLCEQANSPIGTGTALVTALTGMGLPQVSPRWYQGQANGSTYRGRRFQSQEHELLFDLKYETVDKLRRALTKLSVMLQKEPFRLVVQPPQGPRWYCDAYVQAGGQFTWAENIESYWMEAEYSIGVKRESDAWRLVPSGFSGFEKVITPSSVLFAQAGTDNSTLAVVNDTSAATLAAGGPTLVLSSLPVYPQTEAEEAGSVAAGIAQGGLLGQTLMGGFAGDAPAEVRLTVEGAFGRVLFTHEPLHSRATANTATEAVYYDDRARGVIAFVNPRGNGANPPAVKVDCTRMAFTSPGSESWPWTFDASSNSLLWHPGYATQLAVIGGDASTRVRLAVIPRSYLLM